MPLLIQPATSACDPLDVDFSGILPDRLRGLTTAEIATLSIRVEGRTVPLASRFAISGDAHDGSLECRGDFGRVHHLAAGMTDGSITVAGDVGHHTAVGMAGGRLTVTGRAGDWLAAGMTGGEVIVGGSVGDNAAAALPGCRHGLEGGRVLVGGDAGVLAGSRMRRGLLVVCGSCGEAAGWEMRAGTLVTTRTGADAVQGMRRGSLVLLSPDHPPVAGFSRGRTWTPSFLALLAGALPAGPPWAAVASRLRARPWHQWHGDPLDANRGEILIAESGDSSRDAVNEAGAGRFP